MIDFHRRLFLACNYCPEDFHAHDTSNWYKNNGGKAIKYYTNFFLLFITHGILFENFLTIKNTEGDFTKNIVLPSLEKAINLVGVKPLIVPLEPLDTETDEYWYYYDDKIKNISELLTLQSVRGIKHREKIKPS